MVKNKNFKKRRVTFVHSESESFAIECLSSLLKKQGHDVSLVFDPRLFDSSEVKSRRLEKLFNIRDVLIKQIIDTKPDLIGFSVFTYNYQWALKMAKLIKAKVNVPIIFGGIHPTLTPETVIKNDCVDIVCVGEGEEALLELMKKLDSAKRYQIKNLWFKKDGKIIKNKMRSLFEKLDSLPFPDKDLFTPYHPIYHSGYGLVAGRGCPFSCTFCCANALRRVYGESGHYLRKRSVDHVIAELVWAKKRFKPTMVTFVDDVFVINMDWLRDFAGKYKKQVNLPFNCDAHPAGVTTEMVKLLKKAGCNLLILGVQSASEKVRRDLLKRPETNDQIRKAAQICHAEGLDYTIDHIMNLPSEKISDLVEAVAFYNEIRPTIVNTFILTYYPQAEIAKVACMRKLLTKEDMRAITEGKAPGTYSLALGGKRKNNLGQFIFWLNALPLLPRFFVKKAVEEKWVYKQFSPPVWLISVVRFLIRIKIGRPFDTIYIMRLLLKRAYINLKLKYWLVPKGQLWQTEWM